MDINGNIKLLERWKGREEKGKTEIWQKLLKEIKEIVGNIDGIIGNIIGNFRIISYKQTLNSLCKISFCSFIIFNKIPN